MRYSKFQITNFKGIKSAQIVLPPDDSTAVALIGLNESGKTTILQAIYSFSPNDESKVLFERDKKPAKPDIEIIPRGKISSFTGDVTVQATIEINSSDKDALTRHLKLAAIQVDPSSIPDRFTIKNVNTYNAGEHVEYKTIWNIHLRLKSGNQKKFRRYSDEEWAIIWRYMRGTLPDIAYFPTFVFDLPEKIYLDGHDDDPTNVFYRTIISDIFNYQGDGLTIEDHVLARIQSKEFLTAFGEFLQNFWGSSAQQRVTHAMDLASATLTDVIIRAWHEIFNEKITDKKIELEWKPEAKSGSQRHSLYVKFKVRQGTDLFDISDRSLGFRWFFCFLLFTQFRSHRKTGQGTLFLFDEPASNLHAKAQERLLRSFADISKGDNALIYSTHSQHMINPSWIDFSYIVENTEVNYEKSASFKSVTSNNSDIRAVRYQSFVNENPGKTSYYQPVLDRLEVKPSLLELRDGATLVEGKSDFYILRYMADRNDRNIVVVPAFGSTTFETLIPLLMGLASKFYVLLDSDQAGADAKSRYARFDLSEEQFLDFQHLTGKKEPEALLADSDYEIIKDKLGLSRRPNKKQVMRFFRQVLSEQVTINFSEKFNIGINNVLDRMQGKA